MFLTFSNFRVLLKRGNVRFYSHWERRGTSGRGICPHRSVSPAGPGWAGPSELIVSGRRPSIWIGAADHRWKLNVSCARPSRYMRGSRCPSSGRRCLCFHDAAAAAASASQLLQHQQQWAVDCLIAAHSLSRQLIHSALNYVAKFSQRPT